MPGVVPHRNEEASAGVANSGGKVDQHGVSSGVQVPTENSDLNIFLLYLLHFLYLLYFCILYFSGCIYLYLLLWNTGASNYCFLMLVRQISDWPNMSI